MMAIARRQLHKRLIDGHFWSSIADQACDWWDSHRIAFRDATLLLPHPALLPAARSAFARRGGWQPRIETPWTLAESLGPAAPPAEGALSGDRVIDRLEASSMLLRERGFAQWRDREPRAFAAAVDGIVDTAQALARAAGDLPPEARAAWWQRALETLPVVGGPGAIERQLARMALHWAAEAPPPATDRLWRRSMPGLAGLALAGGDPLVEGLLGAAVQAGHPALGFDADPPASAPFEDVAAWPEPQRQRVETLEDEAGATVMAVLQALSQGRVPVAVVAEDRLVVRRSRALLERAGVPVIDETGWTLSTTRAAAAVMACLRAALPAAGRDVLVEAMKAAGPESTKVAEALEDAWRRDRSPEEQTQKLLEAFKSRLAVLRRPGMPTLLAWLDAVESALPDLLASLGTDAAGRQVLAALRLGGDRRRESSAWVRAAQSTALDLPGFVDWVDRTLEACTFVPGSSAGASVVITPLALAAGRPFPAVVFPSCDQRHLGAMRATPGLLPDPVALSLGLALSSARQQEREALAFAALLRTPGVVLIRRSHDGAEPLAPSPWVELTRMARRRAGLPDSAEQVPTMPTGRVARRALARPAPALGDRLPTRLSATAVEALRECPYQFYVREALGLREAGELDEEADHSDYGRWMHATLHEFHLRRSGGADRAELDVAAEAAQDAMALDPAQMWPFRAAFADFATRYLRWLHGRDEEGWRFQVGEVWRRIEPAALEGLSLEGRLDRVDHGPDGRLMVIDYKTGSPDKLKRRVKQRMEDTQLAFYAALVADDDGSPPRAAYLPLRDREEVVPIEHQDVADSARRLVEGLAADLAALRSGQGAVALGEPPACDHCPARGLCRRDHWGDA